MGDSKKRSIQHERTAPSTRLYLTLRPHKRKTKDYVKENVIKIKEFQNKSPESTENPRKYDVSIPYYKRLKGILSPHIKISQKLLLMKQTECFPQIFMKKSKGNLYQQKKDINNTRSYQGKHPQSKNKKSQKHSKAVKQWLKDNIITHKKEPQSLGLNKGENISFQAKDLPNASLFNIPLQNIKATRSKNNVGLLPKDSLVDVKSGEYYQQPKLVVVKERSKGFRNEGCQTKSQSTESINSRTIIRYPNNKSGETIRKELCEKKLQTEIGVPSIQSSKLPVIKPRHQSGKFFVHKVPPKQKEEKINFKPPSGYEKLQNKRITGQNVSRSNQNKTDQKEHALLNEILTGSNEMAEQKDSQMAVVNDVQQIEKEPKKLKTEVKVTTSRIPYLQNVLLPDDKKQECLLQMKKRRDDLVAQLNEFPVASKTPQESRKKLALGKRIDTIDKAMKFFTKEQLYIDANKSSSAIKQN